MLEKRLACLCKEVYEGGALFRFLLIVIFAAGAWYAGRFLAYDSVSERLFEKKVDLKRNVIVNTQTGKIEVVINLDEIRPEELNQHFGLKKALSWPPGVEGDAGTKLEVGSPFRVLAVEGENLRIEPLGREGEVGVVSVDDTYFIRAITRERFAQAMAGGGRYSSSNFGKRLREGEDISKDFEMVNIEANAQSARGKKKVVADKVNKASKAPLAGAVSIKKTKLGEEEIKAHMREFLEANEFESFSLPIVKGWYAGEEEVGGKVYQAGYVKYEGETVFGIQETQAIALFEHGRLVRWYNPITGTDLD